MLLGDSYVASWEVPLEQTFHKRLEAHLEKEDPLGRGSYQVIAFGQGRSAQEKEIEWMRQYAPIYRPDIRKAVTNRIRDAIQLIRKDPRPRRASRPLREDGSDVLLRGHIPEALAALRVGRWERR